MDLVFDKAGFFPVTALEYVSNRSNQVLLAGAGPMLKAFDDGKEILSIEALPEKNIHGIHTGERTICSILPLIVYGQKALQIIELAVKDLQICVDNLSGLLELNDWIFDVHWLSYTSLESYELVLITAHNDVTLVKHSFTDTLATVVARCETRCILYSAQLRRISDNTLAIASGTVFNTILIWCANLSEVEISSIFCPVCLELQGHEGVIMDVKFTETLSKLASVSDDRTIRIWVIPRDWSSLRHQQIPSNQVLYGHTARVWSMAWLPNTLLSIGEDATCRVWDHEGNALNTITGHKGRNIWSIAYDEHNGTVATGGEDCSIRTFRLEEEEQKVDMYELMLPHPVPSSASSGVPDTSDRPRSVALWKSDTALCLTDSGCVLQASLSVPSLSHWTELHRDSKYSGYSIMALSTTMPLLALGNLSGDIKLLHLVNHSIKEWRAHRSKVFSLVWTEARDMDELLLTCGPEGEMICWNVKEESSGVITSIRLSSFLLPPSKHRWVTSAAFIPLAADKFDIGTSKGESMAQLLVCGDRKGSVHVYLYGKEGENNDHFHPPHQSFRGAHGSNGVTHILVHKENILTCGRDGFCREFCIDSRGTLTEKYKFKPVKGMDMLQKVEYSGEHGLLAMGFRSIQFILHNTQTNRTLMSVTCGGGHRSFALSTLAMIETSGHANFLYIKESSVYLAHLNVPGLSCIPVLQKSFLGREALVMELLRSHSESTGSSLVAVGGEDCSIALVEVRVTPARGSVDMNVLRHLTGHISSVRALAAMAYSPGLQLTLLFSGGGRASIKAWLINYAEATEPIVSLQCEYNLLGLSTHQKRRKKRKQLIIAPECRVMTLTAFPFSEVITDEDNAILVAAGCSDGVTRLFLYEKLEKSLQCTEEIDHHHHCLLAVKYIILKETVFPMVCHSALLCTAATDGQIAIWDVTPHLLSLVRTQVCESDSTETADPVCKKSVPVLLHSVMAHQSGINDFAITTTQTGAGEHELLVVSVGDDSTLSVMKLFICLQSGNKRACLLNNFQLLNAHDSCISGVKLLAQNLVVTTSTDQRLKLWKLVFDKAKPVSVESVWSVIHDIADAASLVAYTAGGNHIVLVCGIGLEYFRIPIDNSDCVMN